MNGFKLKAKRKIDWQEQFKRACEAFERNGFFILGAVVIGVFSLLYFPFFWARGGATPGMKVAGIRVVNDRDGSRIGWGPALLRLVGMWVSGAVFYIGFVWILVAYVGTSFLFGRSSHAF